MNEPIATLTQSAWIGFQHGMTDGPFWPRMKHGGIRHVALVNRSMALAARYAKLEAVKHRGLPTSLAFGLSHRAIAENHVQVHL